MTNSGEKEIVCPRCGVNNPAPPTALHRKCVGCSLGWTQERNITVWEGTEAALDQRLLPVAWINRRNSVGFDKIKFWAMRALWSIFKVAGFPIRYLLQRRLSMFLRRSMMDLSLAKEWRDHYLRGLKLPENTLMFESSYRKQEKLGFARLLGFRIVIQDIRKHAWWGDCTDAWFHCVPVASRYLPAQDGSIDVAFTDGVIFDTDSELLDGLFREYLRILRPGGYFLIWGGNSLSKSRTRSEVRWHGRIHSLENVRGAVKAAGFEEVDFWFEGYAPPQYCETINMIRRVLSPGQFKTYDIDSWLAHVQRPERRAYWVLRLIKPDLEDI